MIFLMSAWVGAQAISISKPEDKKVSPGDFVTLVFRITTETDQELDVKVSTRSNWTILKQAGLQNFEAQKTKPVVVTVAVPNDARANLVETLELSLSSTSQTVKSSLSLNVEEFYDLEVQLNDELIVGQDGLNLTLKNRGNVIEQISVQVRTSDEIVFNESQRLEPFSEQTLSYLPIKAGIYFVDFSRQEEALLTKSFRVLEVQSSEPDQLMLQGSINAYLSTRGQLNLSSSLSGPLSDFYTFTSNVDIFQPETMFAELSSEAYKLRAGRLSGNSFGLGLNTGLGLSGTYYFNDDNALAASLSWLEENRYSGYLAAKYQQDQFAITAGTGLYKGNATVDLIGLYNTEDVSLQSRINYLDDALNLVLSSDYQVDLLSLSLDFSASQLLTKEASLGAGFSLQQDELGLFYGGLNYPMESDLARDIFVGLSSQIPSALPGQLDTNIQWGLGSSFATLNYKAQIEAGWQTANSLGLRSNQAGFGVVLDSSWLATEFDKFAFSTNLSYYPSSSMFDLELEVEGVFDPTPRLEIPLFASWNLQDASLDLGAELNWFSEYNLDLNISNNLNFDFTSQSWHYDLSLHSNYSFDWHVPDAITDLAGGRNLGTLIIKVLAEGEAIEGVKVVIARKVYITDSAGEISLELVPNSYEVNLDESSLAVTYQLLSETTQSVEIPFQEEVSLTYEATYTTAIEGQVVTDSNADGIPDSPSKGLVARLILTDANGLRRQVLSNEEGFFSMAQIPPGPATLNLVSVPKGGVIIGQEMIELDLIAREISNVTFLVQPAEARSQSFTQNRVRIRTISLEADPVPPGSAPLVYVDLSGEVDRLILRSDFGEVPLTFSDGTWQGRFRLPEDLSDGIISFEAVAYLDNEEISKKARLQISEAAPAYIVELSSPVNPGEKLEVKVQTWLEPEQVLLNSSFGELEMIEVAEGSYSAEVLIPQDTSDAIYDLTILFKTASKNISLEQTFRVLIP